MGRVGAALPRPQFRELVDTPARPVAMPPTAAPLLPFRWGHCSVDDLVQAVQDHLFVTASARGAKKPQISVPAIGARIVLHCLSFLPGESWQDRWSLVDTATAGVGRQRTKLGWREYLVPGASEHVRTQMTYGLGVLLVMDVFRPSYAWQQCRQLNVFNIVGEYRDPEAMRTLGNRIEELGTPSTVKKVRQAVGRIQLHTGKSIRQVTAQDLLDMDAALSELNVF